MVKRMAINHAGKIDNLLISMISHYILEVNITTVILITPLLQLRLDIQNHDMRCQNHDITAAGGSRVALSVIGYKMWESSLAIGAEGLKMGWVVNSSQMLLARRDHPVRLRIGVTCSEIGQF
jgi:hypothetical protein